MIVWASLALADDVTLSLQRYRDLTPEAVPTLAPAPFVRRREVVVTAVGDDELRFVATWWLEAPRRDAVGLPLTGPEVRVRAFTVNGRPAPLGADEVGTQFAAVLGGPTALRVEGSVDRADPTAIALLPGAVGEVVLPLELALSGALEVAPGRWAAGSAPELLVEPRAGALSERGQLVFGELGYGLTYGEGEVRRAARLRWRITSGSLTDVSFVVPGAGPDLTVTGPQVGEVARSGDRVSVHLSGEERTVVDLEVRTSGTLPGGELAHTELGLPTLDGVFRTEATVVLARDGELDVVPELTGLAPIGIGRLPDVTDGLVDGATTAAFAGPGGAGGVDVFRFTPAEGPATLCDVASFAVALSDDGRALLRAHYTVRNDRGHLLHVTPPPGFVPISAMVSGSPVTIARDGDTWLVPMEKSVESVNGLLTFPVEVAFLGDGDPWLRRSARRPLPLPAIDAPVAVARATVHLPPGWVDRTKPGRGDAVASFTEGQGITYGFAVGDVRAAEADVYWQAALSSWVDNDFEEAQRALDRIVSLGGTNENVVALQGNLDVIAGKRGGDAGGESVIDRRIKDQARARAIGDLEEQRRLLEAADQAMVEGKYDEAEEVYTRAKEVTEKLSLLSNAEDVAQEEVLAVTEKKREDNTANLMAKNAYRAQASNVVNLEVEEARKSEEESRARRVAERSSGRFTAESLELSPEAAARMQAELAARTAATEAENQRRVAEEARPALTIASGEAPDRDADSIVDLDDVVVMEPPVDEVPAAEEVEVYPVQEAAGLVGDMAYGSGFVEIGLDEVDAEPAPTVQAAPPPPSAGPGRGSRPAPRPPARASPARAPADPNGPTVEAPERPAVVATSSSVVIPTGGEAVRYQHLLLPAGQALSLPIEARRRRR